MKWRSSSNTSGSTSETLTIPDRFSAVSWPNIAANTGLLAAKMFLWTWNWRPLTSMVTSLKVLFFKSSSKFSTSFSALSNEWEFPWIPEKVSFDTEDKISQWIVRFPSTRKLSTPFRSHNTILKGNLSSLWTHFSSVEKTFLFSLFKMENFSCIVCST